MHCPDCGSVLITVTLGTEPPIKLDVCSSCSGVWTDQGETNFFKVSDLANVALPGTPHRVPAPQDRYCPKDHTPLSRNKGENIPEDVVVFHCSSCGGNWFPTGQLKHFKEAQRVKLSFFKTWHIPISSPAAILLPVLLLMIITGSIVVTVISIQQQIQTESQAKSLVGKPVVRNISPTEVFISFTTNAPVATSLIYWQATLQAPVRQKIAVSAVAQTTHTVRISNLLPGTTYQYQITLSGAQPITTEEFTFTTLPLVPKSLD